MASQSLQGTTPFLGQFLVALNGFITARNSAQLSSYLALEPPFSSHYDKLIDELRNSFPRGREEALESKCSSSLPAAREGADGSPWSPFVKFVVAYLAYLRDVDPDPSRYLRTYESLSELQVRANSALQHPVLGHLILPVVLTNARLVCRLAIGLDKRPELLRQASGIGAAGGGGGAGGGEEGGPRETLPERAANILRNAFVICLNDRSNASSSGSSAGSNKSSRTPEGKKSGIYVIANLCLKILFQCRKTRNATQIFENIYNLSPPLSLYPKSERVAYLYYLGRFLVQNGHFYRAQRVLQAAYDESPARDDCVRQRRQILLYLVTANLLLGRFPSEALLSRPEAAGFSERFLPLCHAIRSGDLGRLHSLLSLDAPHAEWFLHFRILLPLRNRAEVLLWRSLVRKTWLLCGTRPEPGTKIAPTVDVRDLVAAFAFVERRGLQSQRGAFGNANGDGGYIDPDFEGLPADQFQDDVSLTRDAIGVESVLSSLIDQGLLNGYLSHPRSKFAITGSKSKGGDALAAGFPNPWEVLRGRAEREGMDKEIPGWKKASAENGSRGPGGVLGGIMGGGFGLGTVLNLSGLRPVGAAG